MGVLAGMGGGNKQEKIIVRNRLIRFVSILGLRLHLIVAILFPLASGLCALLFSCYSPSPSAQLIAHYQASLLLFLRWGGEFGDDIILLLPDTAVPGHPKKHPCFLDAIFPSLYKPIQACQDGRLEARRIICFDGIF